MRQRPPRLVVLPALALAAALLAGCVTAPRPRTDSPLAAWAEGPVRWLLVRREWRELQRVTDRLGALAFVDRFWSRRDPDPRDPENTYRDTFRERVEAADMLFREEGRAGSLTDRGGALILFGSPTELRVSSEPALTWQPEGASAGGVGTRTRQVEYWIYPAESLDYVLQRELGGAPVVLRFAAFGMATRLEQGREFLALAAEAAVRR